MRGKGTVKYIRTQRIKWWGHLNKTEKTKTVRKITEWNPIAMRTKRHPKNRWKGEVLNDLKELKVKNWTCLVKYRNTRYKLVQKTKTHKDLSCQQQQQQQKKKKKKRKDDPFRPFGKLGHR
jgi:hypothetical protein